MGKFKRSKGANGYDTDASDSVVSELSNGDSSTHSKSSIRVKFSNFRKKKPSDMTAFVGSASSGSEAAHQPQRSMSPPAAPLAPGAAGGTAKSAEQDRKRLLKDAKSRFNIGLVYLKTGDYAKAQENLEHSLFCHIQLAGHDPKAYTNDAVFAIAGVREKLGDCYLGNTAVVEKYHASDHYEEARRLLKSVDPEDASDNIKDMLQRVEEKLKQPELANSGAKRKPPSFLPSNANVGGASAGAAAASAVMFNVEHNSSPPKSPGKQKKKQTHLCQVTGKLLGGTHICPINGKILSDMEDVTEDGNFSVDDDWEEAAMAHLKRDNHRTAFNTLKSVKDGGGLKNVGPQRRMADSMMKVAVSALKAEKTSVAADAYEEAYAVLKLLTLPNDPGEQIMKRAVNGCIKCNNLLAKEMEVKQDYDVAISHRTRAYQLLDEQNRIVPACHQQVKIAYLHGEKEHYEKSTEALWEAIRGLQQGVMLVDSLAPDRRDLLVKCYQMQAICYAKSKKYKDALEQYDELLPLIAKKGGQGSKEYNSALIHKSALLVTMNHHLAASALVDKYLKLAEISEPDSIVLSGEDHVLALDTSAATHIKLGDVDKAIAVFKRKLAFVKKLPNSNGMISDTLHKLGCLLANKNQHQSALSYLNESLVTKKMVYGGKHKSVLETMWAVAATNQTLGDNNKALNEYTVLLDKMATVDDMPVDVVTVQHSAGKLYFEEGKVDKAVHFFRQALHEAETSGNHQLQSEITLNLANALSASGELDKAMNLYDELLKMKSLKKTKIFFLARFDKSLLLIKMGEVERGKEILHKIAENSSSMANGVRGKTFLKLGNLAVSDGNIDEALGYFKSAFDEANDLSGLVHTKRSIAMAQFEAGQIDICISALEDVLEDLSHSDVEAKSVNLLKAEIWNCLAGVYKTKDDLPQAKNFAKLALQAYKTELGETNHVTLRNASNLQLLILEEAEGLKRKEAKPIINAAKYELEEALEAFVSLDDPSFRLDVVSLKTNLGFVAVWQDKVKKARKLVSQIKDIELPLEHPLLHRIPVLEECVKELEKKHGITSVAEDSLKNDGQESVKKMKTKNGKKGGAYKFRS